LDNFLYAFERLEDAGLQLSAIAGDADGGALCPRHGMGAKSEAFNLLAYGPHVVFRRIDPHDDKHDQPLGD
jgi:hypothetical protein